MSAFFGMRGSGDWETNEEKPNYRQGILRLYPNGRLPITAITSMMPSAHIPARSFSWWTQTIPAMGGAVTKIYTDAAMSSGSEYTSGGVIGTVLYVKTAEATADEFRSGYEALLRCSTDVYLDCVAKVIDVLKNGSSSRITVKLLEADDNSTTHYLASCDVILAVGSMQPEGSPIPDSVAYNPTEINNKMQIFETSLDLTRTAMQIELRSEDAYTKTKRDALELHGFLMEKAWIYGIPTSGIGANGKPEQTAGGIKWFIKTYAPSNVLDYTLDSGDYAGKTWLEGGEDWIDEKLELAFRYGTDDKLAVCGSGALLGMQKLAKQNGNMTFSPGADIGYGVKLTEWKTSFGSILLKTHPLLSSQTVDRNSIIIIEPKNMLEYVYIQDTVFKPDTSYMKGGSSIDGKKESWLSEASMRLYHPEKGMVLYGVGNDNTVS